MKSVRTILARMSGGLRSVPLLLLILGLCMTGCSSSKEQPPEKQADVKPPGQNIVVHNRIDLAWLPSDAELFVRLEVANLWKAPLLQELVVLPSVQQNLERMQTMIGLQPADVESLTMAAAGISEQVRKGAKPNPASLATNAGDKSLAVIRLSKPVDAASLRLTENKGQSATHSGKTYYRFAPPEGSKSKPVGLYLAGPKLLLIGTEQQVQAAMSQGERQARRPDLDFINPDQQLLIVFAPKDMAAIIANLPDAGSKEGPAEKVAVLTKKNLKAFCLGIKIGDGVDLVTQIRCTDPAAAEAIKQQLDVLIQQGRDTFSKSKEKMPPELAAAADQMVGSLKTSQKADTLTTSINVSSATVGTLKESGRQMASFIMMAAMMSGGGNNPPGLSPGGSTSEPPSVKLPTAAPKGLKASAIVRWSRGRTFSSGRELPPHLELWVYLIGEQPQQAVAWGDVQIKQGRADTGETLSQNRRPTFGRSAKRFYPVKRQGILSNHPRHGVRTVIQFAPPKKPIAKIAEVSGSVAIQVATEKKPVLIRNIQSLVGKTIDHPELKLAGVTLRVVRQGSNLKISLEKGNPVIIGKVTAIDSQGKAVRNITTFRQGFGNRISYGLFLGSKAPTDLGVELALNLGIRQVKVPFHFKNIRVPLMPSNPGVPPATTAGIPAGLKLAAKTNWSRLTRSGPGGGQPLPPQLEVVVSLEGKPAAKAVGWGFVKVNKAQGPKGLTLTPARSRFGSTDKFHSVKRSRLGSKQTKDRVRVPILLKHPSAPLQEVAGIEGVLQLRVARRQKTITISNFVSRVGKPIENRDLQSAGVKLKLEKQGIQFKLVLTEGDSLVMGKVDVVDAQGKPIKKTNVYRFTFSKKLTHNISTSGQKLPANAGLRVTLNLDLTTLKVPFQFKHLSVPDLPLR